MTESDRRQPAVQERREARKAKTLLPDMPRQMDAGFWGTVIALIALIISGVSLYQSNLKQPMPTLYLPGSLRFGHDESHNEFFAIPITIVNHGSRDAVVTRIALSVAKEGASNKPPVFVSSYMGNAPKPSESLFSPISVAGHASFAGAIVFASNSQQDAPAMPEKGAYSLCLAIQSETGDDIGFLSSWLSFQPFGAELPGRRPLLRYDATAGGPVYPAVGSQYYTREGRRPLFRSVSLPIVEPGR
jgi:hypothetical protein